MNKETRIKEPEALKYGAYFESITCAICGQSIKQEEEWMDHENYGDVHLRCIPAMIRAKDRRTN